MSDEARLGSLTHWAYINKPTPKTSATAVNERPRRDIAGANSHRAAHGDADNEPKKEPVRRQRRTQAEIEADEARGITVRRGKPGPKSKTADNQSSEQALTAGGATGIVTAKRRKVEHTQSMAATAMERSASTATNAGGRAGSKESPAPDAVKKRTRAPNANSAARKRYVYLAWKSSYSCTNIWGRASCLCVYSCFHNAKGAYFLPVASIYLLLKARHYHEEIQTNILFFLK